MSRRLIAPGAPCCTPDRTVRWVVPPVPGVPRGQVSCRTTGEARWADVRHHEIPKDADVAILTPAVRGHGK